jgi:hypothetical protein
MHNQSVRAFRQRGDNRQWLSRKRLLNAAQRFVHTGLDPVEVSQNAVSGYSDNDHLVSLPQLSIILMNFDQQNR